MNNKLYISPFKDKIKHIQLLQHNDLVMITIGNENEMLTVSNKSAPNYVDNSNNKWSGKDLVAIQESSMSLSG